MNAPNNTPSGITVSIPPETLKMAGLKDHEIEAFNIAINLPLMQQSMGSFGKKMLKQGFNQGLMVGVLLTGGVALLALVL